MTRQNELDRLDLAHQMFRLVLKDRLHLAPIENGPIKILDIGTGTGIWAIEMGNAWPARSMGATGARDEAMVNKRQAMIIRKPRSSEPI